MKNIRWFVPVVFCLLVCIYVIGCGSASGGSGGGGGAPVTAPFSAEAWVSTTGTNTATGTFTDPYKTIQKGLNSVGTGETVGVMAGIYAEHIVWPAYDNLTLRGISMGTVTIDAASTGRCVNIDRITITKASIKSMTLVNGKVNADGGAGIFFGDTTNTNPLGTMYLANVTISNCTIETPGGPVYGAGIYVYSSNYTIEAVQCIFKNNDAIAAGTGGPALQVESLFLSSCEVYGNNTSGSGAITFTSGKLENCIIRNNQTTFRGGGIYVGGALPVDIINCTITSNDATSRGGGIYISTGNPGMIKVKNSIFWGNTSPTGPQICINDISIGGTAEVDYSDVEGGGFAGAGNVDLDPKFASFTDLHLTGDTLASVFEGGTLEAAPSCDYYGNPRPDPSQDPNKCSMGAHEYNPGII